MLVVQLCPTLCFSFMGFSSQEDWSGLPLPSPGDLSDPGTEPQSPVLQADSLLFELPRSPATIRLGKRIILIESFYPHLGFPEAKHKE